MRVVVTGGSGFIGSHLVDFLCSEDIETVVIDTITNHSSTKDLNKRAVHYFADIANPDILPKIIQKDDRVIHLAAQSHVDVSFSKPQTTILSNVLATQNLLQACLDKQADRILIMSTDEVYGSKENINDIKSLDPTNPYSASKAAADMIVNSYKNMYKDMHVSTLRSNNIAGPRQFIRNIIPRFSCLGILGRKMTLHGDGSSRRRYLWVKDAVEALYLISSKGNSGEIYHTGHPIEHSNLEIANKIGNYLGLDDHIEYITDRPFNDTTYPYFEDQKMNDLGWKVTKDLDDFLPETIEWYRKNIDRFQDSLN